MPELRAVSGVGCKGPACFLLRMGGRTLLLDLGRGPDAGRMPDIAGLPPIDAILFSHAHADHTGGLALWQALGRPPLFATAPTIALAGLSGAHPLEGCADILGLPLMTGAAGHAPGAVWMRIGGAEGLLYSGDVGTEGGMFRADPLPRATALVLDASYGMAAEGLPDQIDAIAALAGSGPMLLPAPAGGRGLEMAATLLARGHDVAICADHRRVARVLEGHPDWLTPQGRGGLALLAQARDLLPDSPPEGVMIAAGPNAERGAAQALAQRMAGRPGRIVFTGHVADDTPAQGLIGQGLAQFRRWNVHPPFPLADAMVAAVGPRTMLAAFCDAPTLRALRAGTGWPLAPGTEMDW